MTCPAPLYGHPTLKKVVIVDNLFNSKASKADRVDKAIAVRVEAGPSRVSNMWS
ncbi:MAG: hypothetical protein PHD43_07675 [Methylococcales bacterium]|nr:hypothetical protein [Methylococcales bacterium]